MYGDMSFFELQKSSRKQFAADFVEFLAHLQQNTGQEIPCVRDLVGLTIFPINFGFVTQIIEQTYNFCQPCRMLYNALCFEVSAS